MSFTSDLERLNEHSSELKNGIAYKRLECLMDEGSLTELDAYTKNGEQPAEVLTAFGTVDGCPVYAFAQNPEVQSGAMGKAQAAKIKRVYDLAEKTGVPVVGIYDSKGAYIKEGIEAIHAYGKLMLRSNNLSGVVPQISLILGTCAGSGAVLAASADLVIVSEKSELFLNAPFILQDKTGKVGAPQAVLENGIAQIFEKEEQAAITKARELITLLPQNNLSVSALTDPNAPSGAPETLNLAKPSLDALIDAVVDFGSRLPLSGAFAPEAQTLFARINGTACGIVATDPAVDEGRLTSEGCRKIARFIRLCDAFSVPIVTFVDTVGFIASADEEISGMVKDAALVAHAYAEATTVKVSLITGNAFGCAYSVLAGRSASADTVLAWPQAVISTLNPKAAATILMEERLKAGESLQSLAEEYVENYANAFQIAAAGYIDDIIEPAGTRDKIFAAMDMLSGKRVATLSKKHSNMPI